MKYISLLLLTLIFVLGCGKKTDPISKDSLENVAIPKNVIVKAQPEGVFIANNEESLIIVEKAIPQGDTCSEYQKIKVLEPRGDFIDTDVVADQVYYYRLTKKTVKYSLISEPRVFPIVFQIPPVVTNASYVRNDDNISINVESSSDFMRMDIYSGKKSIVQTGYKFATIQSKRLTNVLTIVLTDYFGNKGTPYTLSLVPEKEITPPDPVTGLAAAYIGGALRIVWDSSTKENYTYEIKVCENVSCETHFSSLPFLVYQKEFDKCLDIIVNALTTDGRSIDSALRFCK